MTKVKKCPNCGNKSLHFLLGKWTCVECEYHEDYRKRKGKGSFR